MDHKAEWFVGTWPDYLTLGLLPLGAWVVKRLVDRVDRRRRAKALTIEQHGERLVALERDRVTRADLDEVTASLTAQISNNQIRTEEKLERIWTHLAGGGR